MMCAVVLVLTSPMLGERSDSASAQRARPGPAVNSYTYARLGYGAVLAEERRGASAFGFGFRGDLESFALDVSFLNFVIAPYRQLFDDQAFAGSILRLEVLRYLAPESDASMYAGGGLSWAHVSSGRSIRTDDSYTTGSAGSGIQAELTAGYELTRSSPVRIFVQGDVGLPLFKARRLTYPATPRAIDYGSSAVGTRYTPSVAVTFGIGWQRRRP